MEPGIKHIEKSIPDVEAMIKELEEMECRTGAYFRSSAELAAVDVSEDQRERIREVSKQITENVYKLWYSLHINRGVGGKIFGDEFITTISDKERYKAIAEKIWSVDWTDEAHNAATTSNDPTQTAE